MTAILRPARPSDSILLAELKLMTFRETFLEGGFAIPYPADDLAIFEARSYAPDTVAAEIVDPARATWVVEESGKLLAYAQVGPCKLPHPDVRPDAGELYQIYVRNDAQGHGPGRGNCC